MSFLQIPSQLCTPALPPNLTFYDDSTYRGFEADAGLYAFHCNLGYVIADDFVYRLNVDNENFYPVFSDVNGYIYWSSGSKYIYNSVNFGWILCDVFPGFEPEEYYDSDTSEYKGDVFWSGSLPDIGTSSSFAPRGEIKIGGTSKTVTSKWERWQSDSRLGEYSPQDGAIGSMFFGSPRWVDDDGVNYTRSVSKIDGKYTYGSIYYMNGKWLIGTVNNEKGWWEGSEPSKIQALCSISKSLQNHLSQDKTKRLPLLITLLGMNVWRFTLPRWLYGGN